MNKHKEKTGWIFNFYREIWNFQKLLQTEQNHPTYSSTVSKSTLYAQNLQNQTSNAVLFKRQQQIIVLLFFLIIHLIVETSVGWLDHLYKIQLLI